MLWTIVIVLVVILIVANAFYEPSISDEWIQQVHELAPGVSLSAIRKDLEITRNVEATVERILSGQLGPASSDAINVGSSTGVLSTSDQTDSIRGNTQINSTTSLETDHTDYSQQLKSMIEASRKKFEQEDGISYNWESSI
ncbi:hypothetical protein DAMA08_039140 [Martiniozyma asiatica (nom. inval.)]|nr:hypothetical protein DAMA08_039140 [Martiniozyma asiatica]